MNDGAIIVSGGSKGLGCEIVRHLLKDGRKVGTFARHGTQEIRTLEDRFRSNLLFAEVDACDQAGLKDFVSKIRERFGALAALVNNAAASQDGFLANTSPEAVQKIIAVNLEAPVLLTRLVIKEMLLQGSGGRIVSIGSISGRRGYSGLAVYSATKAALEGFTRALAVEAGPRNILVNAIAPGFFESDMSSVLQDGQIETIRKRTPTGRLVRPADILPVLDMLLFSDNNLTGQVIAVDGGAGC